MFIRLYALAVCFASILCIAISTGIALYDMVQIAFPKLTMDSYLYQNLQSNEAFRRSHFYPGRMPAYPIMNERGGLGIAGARSLSAGVNNEAPLTDEEVGEQRQQQLALALDNVRHDAQRSLLPILVILLVSIPLFLVHWYFARKLDAQMST